MDSYKMDQPLIKLAGILNVGPVERGLYIASGPRDITYRILDGLVELLKRQSLMQTAAPSPSSPNVLIGTAQLKSNNASTVQRDGDPGIIDPRQKHAGMTTNNKKSWRRQSQIGQIIWVDSGNLFDPYYMCAAAKQKGLDPNKILRSVRVGRPFTAFQYHQMLANVPNAALVATPSSPPETCGDPLDPRQKISGVTFGNSAFWWTPLVVISDLMGLFYDPELPQDDMKRAFYQFLLRLSFLKDRAIILAALHEEEPPAHRRYLLEQLRNMVAPKEVGVRQWVLEPAA